MSSPDLERLRLDFDKAKWADERELRTREQMTREEESKARLIETSRSRWSSPIVIAVVAAAVAAVGNLIVTHQASVDQRELETKKAANEIEIERTKAEAARILEVVKTGTPDKAAENLKVLMDTYLITDAETRKHIDAYLETREPGHGLSLPVAQTAPSPLPTPGYQPPPPPIGRPPFHLALQDVPGALPAGGERQPTAFQVTGNTGGVRTPFYQASVAARLTQEVTTGPPELRPQFLYLLGNVTYFTGKLDNYYGQFYAPYAKYPAPILAIPGNHDGAIDTPGDASLLGYSAAFCASSAAVLAQAGDTKRPTMTEPNSYWTLETPFATIIGLYTNVPAGGSIDKPQLDWLIGEMKAAPPDKALIVAMHHAPFSFDRFHSGSGRMATALQTAINASGRVPNAVLSAVMNNYQRIEVTVAGHVVPFFVIGTGGYPNLHPMSSPVGTVTPSGSKLVAGDDRDHGFVSFAIDARRLTGRFIASPSDATAAGDVRDSFDYSAEPIRLPPGQSAALPIEAPPPEEAENSEGGTAQP